MAKNKSHKSTENSASSIKVNQDGVLPEKLDTNANLLNNINLDDIFLHAEKAVLPFEDIFIPFQEAFLEFVKMEEEDFEEMLAAFPPNSGDNSEFLNLALEELLNVVLEDGGSDVVSVAQTQNEGGVDSVSRGLNRDIEDSLNKFKRIESVERELYTSFGSPPTMQEISIPPLLPNNGLPSAPNLLAGPSIGFHQFESALRTQSSVTLTGNIFEEGASAGPDGLGGLDLNFTRAGSIKNYILGGIEIITPEGNTIVLYTSADSSLGIEIGDYIYTLNNPILHLPNDITDIGQDFNNNLVYINTSLGQIYIDKFEYTIVDSDGDSATAYLSAQIVDDEPTVTDQVAPTIDEANIYPDGSNLPSSPATVSGSLIDGVDNTFGADGGLVSNVTIPGGITVVTATTITVTTSIGELVVDRATGNYTYTLLYSIDNDGDSTPSDQTDIDDNSGLQVFSYEFTDADEDVYTATLTVEIIDDEPIVTLSGLSASLTVDETTFAINDTVSFASLFTLNPGADGLASLLYTLSISATEVDSGLVDTLSNQIIELIMDGSEVVGRTATSHIEVFRISVDADTGVITLNQSRAIVHSDTDDHDDSTTLSAAELIKLTATITDGDGDVASQTADIGTSFIFRDDGPSIEIVDNPTIPALSLDESSFDSVSGFFDVLFATNFGNDGFKDTNNDDIQDADAITYVLSVGNAASGLVDTLSQEAIELVKIGNDIVGRTETGEDEVFRISVNANTGEITFSQSRAVEHPNVADPNDVVGLLDNAIILTATAEDGDGDTDSASINIGSAFSFVDDAPSIEVVGSPVIPELSVDESIFGLDTASFAGLFATVFGNDGFKDTDNDDTQDDDAITYVLSVGNAASGLIDTISQEAIELVMDGNDIIGRTEDGLDEVFRISVDVNTGEITLTQLRSIVHADGGDPNDVVGLPADAIVLTATAEDGDGDTDSASINIGSAFSFVDDAPSIEVVGSPVIPELSVDESIFGLDTASFAGLFAT
ncbi:MAG: DUF5801 repeats-in-toxin domain-containing protein, partial [Candidatus Berkiella sp.]